jgi:hypothetical protein
VSSVATLTLVLLYIWQREVERHLHCGAEEHDAHAVRRCALVQSIDAEERRHFPDQFVCYDRHHSMRVQRMQLNMLDHSNFCLIGLRPYWRFRSRMQLSCCGCAIEDEAHCTHYGKIGLHAQLWNDKFDARAGCDHAQRQQTSVHT